MIQATSLRNRRIKAERIAVRREFVDVDPHFISQEDNTPAMGEKTLWAAVLLLGALDAKSKRDSISAPAWAWINGKGDEVGSFVFCCQAVNKDPDFIRGMIRKTEKKHIKRWLV